jgi:hypothetical protein
MHFKTFYDNIISRPPEYMISAAEHWYVKAEMWKYRTSTHIPMVENKIVHERKQNALMTHGVVEITLHPFLILTLDEGEWSASLYSRFTFGERALAYWAW